MHLLRMRNGIIALLLASACDRSLTRDVHDDAKLTSRVQEVVRPGSDSAAARRVLTVQGFACQTALAVVDSTPGNQEPPAPRLACTKVDDGGKKKADSLRHYQVLVLLEGPTVRGVEAQTWMAGRKEK